MFNKLQIKILLILFVTLSIAVSSNYFLGNKVLKSELLKGITAEAFATGHSLELQVKGQILSGIELHDITGFDEICAEVVKNNDNIEFASVVDLNGTVLFHSSSSHPGIISDVPELLAAVKSNNKATVKYIYNKKSFFGFVIPVYNKYEHVGSVVLGYSEININKKIAAISSSSLIASLVMFLTAMILIVSALSLWVTKPILRLYNATREIFYKGPEAISTIEKTTNDEIGKLSTSFNMMISRLKKTTVSKAYVDNIISSMTDALIVLSPDNKIETVNEATIVLLGYTQYELIDKPRDIIFTDPENMPFKGQWLDDLKVTGQFKNFETRFKTKDGSVIPILLCCSVMKTEEMDVIRIVCTARDITEIKRAEEIMFRQANFDMLTGLPNRHYLEARMSQIINKSELEIQKHTFISLDLDKFKIVNDVCGHHAGDQLMKHISHIMKKNLNPHDIIARLGGDEFGILLMDTDISEGCAIAEKLCKAVKDFRFSWNDKLFTLGVSIGAVEVNQNNNDIEWLLSAADRACYISKEKGGGRVHVFDCQDKELTERQEEMRLMPGLIKAFEEGRFILEYQPIKPVKFDEKKKWFEVLIRMIDENGCVVMPGAFLPAAQRYNMLPSIDRWVIHNFASTYKEKVCSLPDGASMVFNINISGASLNTDSFLDFICEELDKYDVPPHVLCFEITENSAVSNFVDSSQFIGKLKSMGCSFALDDFGSGLSSFTYLKYLPVDYIKIEGTFIRDIVQNPIDYAMESSINEMAHVMGMKTIAEYVESEEIFNCLKDIGIDYLQGHWFGKTEMLERYSSLNNTRSAAI
jgi:diguanylate cyclase (GGDEF)-like protein/PAS domain S-box-containing protein